MATEDVFSTFSGEVKNRHDEMIKDLESINVDNLKTQGVTLSFGGKTFKFTDLEVTNNDDVEEKIRLEFKQKLNEQQQRIRDKINAKINQLLLMHQNKQQEMERKEKRLKKQLEEAALMPDIKSSHMLKGLSVFKGSSNEELLWVYRATYNPRFILISTANGKLKKPIPSRLVTRMKQSIYITINTKGKRIISVKTKKIQGTDTGRLSDFSHYHQQGGGDCWGSWKHPREWKTSDDILRVAQEAEAILETINQGSLASRGPAGLPRSSTLIKAVEKVKPLSEATTIEREGGSTNDDDVWQAI